MKLISIGKFIEKVNYSDNLQDYKTWTEMSKYFEEIFIIVESPDEQWHHQKCEKLDITWIPKRRKPYEFFYFIIKSLKCSEKLIRDNGIDVINVGEPICAGLMAVMLKRKVHKPLVTQLQGQFFNLPDSYSGFRRIVTKQIAKYVCKHSDRIRTVSEEIKAQAIKYRIPENKIFVSTSRCDTDYFDANRYKKDVDLIKKKLKYSPYETILIFVGRLIRAKDVSSILEAMSILKKNGNNNIKLLIVGDGPLRGELEQQAQDCGVCEAVTFYGEVTYEEVPKMLAVGDVFVSPSLDEGMPRAVLEAMSMGLAAIVTPVGGNREIIEDGVNGILVEIGDPSGIAEKIEELIQNPDQLLAIRNNARRRIVEKYEFKKCIKSFADIHFIH